MPRCWPAGWLHTRPLSRRPPHWPRPCSGRASSRSSSSAFKHRYRSRNRCRLSACALLAIPRREVGSWWFRSDSVRQKCPVRAAYFRHVLPRVVGFPHRSSTMRDKTPHGMRRAFPVTVLLRLPVACSTAARRFQHCSVSGFPLPCLKSCIPSTDAFHAQEPLGPPKFFDASLPACHGLRTPADLPILANADASRVAFGSVKTLGVRNKPMSKLYQHFRVRGHPCGLQDTLSTLRPSCSPWFHSRLRHGRKTRYGWVASPYPTGTFTLQETPSLSWRDNARPQPRPEAGAQRTLEAVACMPRLGWGAQWPAGGVPLPLRHHPRLFSLIQMSPHRAAPMQKPTGSPRPPGRGATGAS